MQDDSAQGLHQDPEQSAALEVARRQTESTGPIELIAIASISAVSQCSAPGAQGGMAAEAARDVKSGNEGIASVLLREREVQRKLEASQAALLEAQKEQMLQTQKAERAEAAQRASQAQLDNAKVLPDTFTICVSNTEPLCH